MEHVYVGFISGHVTKNVIQLHRRWMKFVRRMHRYSSKVLVAESSDERYHRNPHYWMRNSLQLTIQNSTVHKLYNTLYTSEDWR